MTRGINNAQWVVGAIGISIQISRTINVRNNGISTQEPSDHRVIKPRVIVIQAGGPIAFLVGIELDSFSKSHRAVFRGDFFMSKIWVGGYGASADYTRSLAGKERLLPAMDSGQSLRSARPITLSYRTWTRPVITPPAGSALSPLDITILCQLALSICY
jgi:hypothetical protein